MLHDLEKNQIIAIFNPLSRRKVGDDSYLDRIDFDDSETIIGPYSKTNWDGRPLKSISLVIRDQSASPCGFLCINIDISTLQTINQSIFSFIKNNFEVPEKSQNIFKDDLYDKINRYIQQYCCENQVATEGLSREDKKIIVNALLKEGAFNEKNAANYIGRILGISRATVYNYLNKK